MENEFFYSMKKSDQKYVHYMLRQMLKYSNDHTRFQAYSNICIRYMERIKSEQRNQRNT